MVISGSMLLVFAVYVILPYLASDTPQTSEPAPTVQAETDVKTVVAAVEPAPQPRETKPAPKPQPKPEPVPEPKTVVSEPEPTLKDPLTITLDRSFQDQIGAALAAYREKEAQQEQTAQTVPAEEPADTSTDTSLKIKSETVDDSEKIGLLIDNYEFDETYENAMKIARHFFASDSYPEAIKWALAANQLNSADDESWLIFAKASLAVGESDQAKKALETYLLKRDSLRVRQLYQSIK